MNQTDKQTIYENLDKLPTLRDFLTEDWINKELEKKGYPSPLICLIKHNVYILELENNLNSIGIENINAANKGHILNLIKNGKGGNVYGIISELDVWALLRRNDIVSEYQPNNSYDFDFSIQLDKEDILVEVTASYSPNILIKKLKEVETSNCPRSIMPIQVDNQSYKDESFRIKHQERFGDRGVPTLNDSDKALSKLKEKAKKLGASKNYSFKTIIILNHISAVNHPCINHPFLNNFKKNIYDFLKNHKEINLVVVYRGDINNSSLYFHPKYPKPKKRFTPKEKEVISQIFSKTEK